MSQPLGRNGGMVPEVGRGLSPIFSQPKEKPKKTGQLLCMNGTVILLVEQIFSWAEGRS